ncbi:MAG: LptF/LptG family permease [Planctomycetales bacterium]|nr:LptF/LptG family permease [Planctomycetales bacterium]
MKILDRYIARNFLFGYFIALCVMVGMFLTIDLFVHLDEFAELRTDNPQLNLRRIDVAWTVMRFYGIRCCLWYKDMAGMIMVVAAVFSLARMTRNNELIAVMASGTSLKRILAPILFLSLFLTGLMVVDQEAVIPRYAYELIRKHDELSYAGTYDVWFIGDDRGSLFCSRSYEEKSRTLHEPLIILREPLSGQEDIYRITGKIQADTAVYDSQREGWTLTGGRWMQLTEDDQEVAPLQQIQPIDFYPSKLTAADIPVRRQEGFKLLLSLGQLTAMENNPGTRRTDMAELALQKHSRITDPLVNLIMLMVALPVLVCRDPKAMKNAIIISFMTTLSCFIVVFACKLFAAEIVFGQVRPALWAWAPIFIFFPVALIEIDSMRT